MTDWSKPYEVSYRVMRVSRVTGLETGELRNVRAGGSITRDQDTDIKESGSLTVEGPVDLGTDRLRVWADCTWHDGSGKSVALGTFLPNIPSRAVDGDQSSSQLDLYGLLQEMADDRFETPYQVRKGSNAVDAAAAIVRSCNLEVAAYDPGDYKLGADWVFALREDTERNRKTGSKLDAVNDLLDLAGYSSARTDEYGRVVLAKYVEPAKRSPAYEFLEGATATFLTSMTDELDLRDVKNVITVIYADNDKEYVGTAVDDDPKSRYSTVSLGLRKAASYEYTSIPESVKTDEQGRKLAQSKAEELLRTNQSVIHRVTFTHTYAPVNITDPIRLDYPTGNVSERLAVRMQEIQLEAGIPITCEARCYQRPNS